MQGEHMTLCHSSVRVRLLCCVAAALVSARLKVANSPLSVRLASAFLTCGTEHATPLTAAYTCDASWFFLHELVLLAPRSRSDHARQAEGVYVRNTVGL